jgi:ABC-type multidrug transport system ATPase subunit
MNLFRSLIPNYELYLLDEPDIGLDKESIKDLNYLIDKINKRGESIIFTSHNQNVLGINNNISQTISL